MIKSLEEMFGTNKSTQYYLKKMIKECINSEEGNRIRERIIKEEGE
jgi:hypothetical protein|tara:strand:- start:539 stop:676 length:138 start_codon:yes stop_codon:yes gene_type:complete